MEKLIQEHLLPNAPEDANEFRTRFLYTEEVSDIFSEYIVVVRAPKLRSRSPDVQLMMPASRQLQDVYNSNMGKYCKVGEKKGMQLAEFLHVMYVVYAAASLVCGISVLLVCRERYQVYCDSFRVRDVKDPFLACKLVVLDEMATAGHKKLFMTDFMELLLRVSVIRYPPKPFVLAEVAKSLQKLFLNHFAKHECIMDAFRETVDQALLQDRIEAFASVISAHKHEHGHDHEHEHEHEHDHGPTRARPRGSLQVLDDEEEDSDDDEDDDDSDDDDMVSSVALPGHVPDTAHGDHDHHDHAREDSS